MEVAAEEAAVATGGEEAIAVGVLDQQLSVF
jgi:hypothetical protein